jgi:hypothetical protein
MATHRCVATLRNQRFHGTKIHANLVAGKCIHSEKTGPVEFPQLALTT